MINANKNQKEAEYYIQYTAGQPATILNKISIQVHVSMTRLLSILVFFLFPRVLPSLEFILFTPRTVTSFTTLSEHWHRRFDLSRSTSSIWHTTHQHLHKGQHTRKKKQTSVSLALGTTEHESNELYEYLRSASTAPYERLLTVLQSRAECKTDLL